jgi:hypothetical protein
MSDQPVRWTPLGNLDKDTEYKLVGKGNYTDALDIIKQDDEGQVSGTIQPTKRNKHAFSLGSVQAQNKKYRITVDGDATKNHALKFLSTKRDYRITTGTGPNGEIEFNGTIASLQAQFYASNLPGAFQVTVFGNTMEFELVAYNHYQWYLESVGDDDVEVVCIQEAIPTDLAGPLKDIGSYDLLGDLFVFSTTQDNEPTELEAKIIVIGPIANNPAPPPAFVLSGPLTTLTFDSPHGLQQGQWIRIIDSSAAWLNGTFVVNNIISPTDVNIVTDTAWGATHPASSVGPAKVFIHPTGIGEIGVAQKNNSTESWTYTRLLRSVELNYITKKSIDNTLNRDGSRVACYYTDDYNPPRSFYYYGSPFQQDGGLSFIDSNNVYDFDSIAEESVHFSTEAAVDVDFVEQLQSNGNLTVGNKWYAVRLVDQDNNATEFSQLYGPVNVYENNNNALPSGAAGSDDGINTSKVNVLSITGYNNDLYNQFELAVLENLGGSFTATVLGPYVLSSSETIIRHTGFETNATSLDVGDLISKFDGFYPIKAKNIREIDERLVLSNIVTVESIDLKDWAASITHSVVRKSIPQKKKNSVGEYENPSNTFDNVGYMLNETYRMGVRVKFKSFGWTDAFWVDDIKIDANPSNTSNPNGDNRRVSGLPNYDLTEDATPVDKTDLISGIDPQNPSAPINLPPNDLPIDVNDYQTALSNQGEDFNTTYPDSERGRGILWDNISSYSDQIPRDGNKNIFIPHLEFNLDMSYQVPGLGGVQLSELVEEVSFVRGVIPKSIVASGFGVLSVEAIRTFIDLEDIWGAEFPPNSELPITGETVYMEYPYWNGGTLSTISITDTEITNIFPSYPYRNTAYNINGIGLRQPIFFNENRSLISIYSNDTIYGNLESGVPPSKLIVTGVPELYRSERINYQEGDINQTKPSYYTHFMPQYQGDTYNEYDIEFTKEIENGGLMMDTQDLGGDLFTKDWGLVPNSIDSLRGPVVKTSSQVLFPGTSELTNGQTLQFQQSLDRGLIQCQLYRDVSFNYPLIRNTSYVSCGHSYKNEFQETTITTRVLGGDTFTCTSFMRTRIRETQDTLERGKNYGTVFVSQSRVNASMRTKNEENFVFPVDSQDESLWLLGPSELQLDSNGNPQGWNVGLINQAYDQSYNINDSVIGASTSTAYSRSISFGDYPVRIIYSIKKIEESLIDSYKKILPLNFKDLDLSFGEINHHENINGELFTLQPRKYQLQYFNTRGTLQGSNEGVEVLIGDASVLGRDGQTLSLYGTQHKWSVVNGSSPGGKDVIYWFNQENGLFMRFGADGTIVLSERHGMRSFSANNTRWTENQHTPALNYGIRSVWDDRFKEAIWTFIGLRSSQGEWGTLPSTQLYAEGDTVTNNTFINYPFDGVPDVYVSLSLHAPIPQSEPGVGNDWETYWRRVDKDDPEYYSVFTLAFNELSNGFSTFYSHLPKTYLKWKNKFLSSHPTERSEIYEHRYGYDKWYEYEGVWKESEPFIEGVVNPFPDQSKKFVAIQALSDNVPDRIELKTKDHESFLVSADFDPEDDAWRTPIKNDILTSQTGDPNDDTESLIGAYMRIKFKFFNGAYNKLNNLIIKVRQRLRRTQS